MAREVLRKSAFGLFVIIVRLCQSLAMPDFWPEEQHLMWNALGDTTEEEWQEAMKEIFPSILPSLSEPKGLPWSKNLSELCSQHWSQVRSDRTSKFYAMSMADSSVTVPSGLLYGALTHPGNWEECVKVRDVQAAKNTSFHGQMCAVNYSFKTGKNSLARRKTSKHDVLLLLALRGFSLGKCVPSTCSATDVAAIYKPLSIVPLRTHLLTCSTLDRPEWEPVDWAAVGVLSSLAAVMALSTAYDVVQRAKSRRPLAVLASFSVYSNGKKLLAMPSSTADATLGCVHGIRFISMMWVVMGHRHMFNMFGPSINILYTKNLFRDWRQTLISNATLSVDTFFVISGILVAYVFMKDVRKTNRFNIIMFYVHRYTRLTPALALVVFFNASLLRHLGSGPMWNILTRGEVNACKDNWWTNLLYVNNYVHRDSRCVSQSWYLMVDMQLFWLSPIVLIPLWKWPVIGISLMTFLSAGGLINIFALSHHYDLPTSTALAKTISSLYFYQHHLYVAAYSRFVPYLIGIGLGYYVANNQQSGRRPRFPLWVQAFLWLSAALLMLGALLGGAVFFQSGHRWSRLENAFYNSLSRSAWSLGVAIVVLLCATGNGRFPNTILSWWGFQVLGRFSYCIYLTHQGFQMVELASWKTYTFQSSLVTWAQFGGDIFVSLFMAAALSLSCESPFMALEKALLGGRRRPATPIQPAVVHPVQ